MTKRTKLRTEYEGAQLGDTRRSERLVALAESMASTPDASFPEALDASDLEGAYRFLRNDAVLPDAMLAPHVRETVRRIGGTTALALHDTTTLSYRAGGKRRGFATSSGAQQFWSHTTLAVAGDGTRRPFGVLHVSNDTRIEHARWAAHVDAVRDLGVDTVHIMDREADDYALLAHLATHGDRFVIRLQHNRVLKEGPTELKRRLADTIEGAPCVERDVILGARPQPNGSKQRRVHPVREGRPARLRISCARVRVPRPGQRSEHLPDEIELTFVRAWEPSPPPNEKAVDWMLMTTEPANLVAAAQVVDWYRARWVVEEFFKALKTGCAIEKRQLETFEGLTRAVALFAPIAWHLLLLRHDARHTPDRPAQDVLSEDQLAALRAIARRPLPLQPTARDVFLAIAALGGHLRNNGEPGWITLARGYDQLRLVALGLAAGRSQPQGCDQS
jgi:hypothetical protein